MAKQEPLHQLYRHFDKDGSLLYVGISLSAFSRMAGHRAYSPWFKLVANVTLETFATRKETLVAEAEAIKNEKPKYNKHHKPKEPPPKRVWTPTDPVAALPKRVIDRERIITIEGKRVLSEAAVKERTTLGSSSIRKLMKAGEFPKPMRISAGRILGWHEDDIYGWIVKRFEARDRKEQPSV